MKPLLVKIRSQRAPDVERATADDNLGRGMEIALMLLVFLGIGWAIDQWLGLFPLFTIVLVVFASVGMFARLKYTYDATMERHEADRLAQRAAKSDRLEDVA